MSAHDLMRHEKKVWSEWFQKIVDDSKQFELRLADWQCNPGDELVLREWDPVGKQYTGRELTKQVSQVIRTKDPVVEQWWSKEDVDKYGFQIISWND